MRFRALKAVIYLCWIAGTIANISGGACEEFIIDGLVTSQNGGHTIDGGDNFTVKSTGEIKINNNKRGILFSGDNN